MSEDELKELDELRGNRSRSQFIRDAMLNQNQSQEEEHRETKEEEQRQRENNQAREKKLEEEASMRGEFITPPANENLGELRDFAALVNQYSSTYSKSQLAEMLAVDRKKLSGKETESQRLKNALFVLGRQHPELDINQLISAISSSPQAQYGPQPVQQQQQEESPWKGIIKDIMPLLMVQMISGNQAAPQQPLSEFVKAIALLKESEKERTVRFTTKDGTTHEVPLSLYQAEQQQQQGITPAQIEEILSRYSKGNDTESFVKMLKDLRDLNKFISEDADVAKQKITSEVERKKIETAHVEEMEKLRQQQAKSNNFQTLINSAFGLDIKGNPGSNPGNSGNSQSQLIIDRISEKFLENAIGPMDLSPEKIKKAQQTYDNLMDGRETITQ